ncbi:hypothetical protein Q4603_11925 [Zobellia galactanivorans]|uniref:hypothetical protein n=1 Tax=Zobellia galactanivorans (strain DSM 12802 / CCUG 47099 / CIP 106680 / NCIMB 13871 / Dsij) TaxID=63186 RepID=UPI001C06F398|nr:hypothetical protein [Zobellia galactanivorans]MBU3026530.1 hypothetical protein [Zobellia galactanivorans]MDO6809328.1 hypothetical protein [Zobellia galactanivorans]
MQRLIFYGLMLLNLLSCKAKQIILIEKNDEVYEIVNSQLQSFRGHVLYKKSYPVAITDLNFYQSSGFFKCKMENPNFEVAKHKTDSIRRLNKSELVKKKLIDEIEKKYIAGHISDLISLEDYEYMKQNTISEELNWEEEKIKGRLVSSKSQKNLVRFSLPVISKSNKWAIMLIKFENSLQAHVYRKNDSQWSSFCSYLLSRSD